MREEGVERRLTTILSVDVVGYSRLMAADEAGTLMRLKTIQSLWVFVPLAIKTSFSGLMAPFFGNVFVLLGIFYCAE